MEWATTERKKEMQRSVKGRPNRTAQLQEEKGRRKGKIRKEYCTTKVNNAGWRMVFHVHPLSASQAQLHATRPAALAVPTCCRWASLRSKLNMKNHGVWPSHRRLGATLPLEPHKQKSFTWVSIPGLVPPPLPQVSVCQRGKQSYPPTL